MILTNEHGIPEPIFQSELRDIQGYKRGTDISVTELISPPRVIALRRQHEKELTEDVKDRLAAWLGKAVHYFLEHHISGMREVYVRSVCHDWTVSGRADRYYQENGRWVIQDHKVCKSYATRGGPKRDWVEQLNLLAALFRINRLPVDTLEALAIYKDWDEDNKTWKEYPQKPAEVFPLEVWSPDEARTFLLERVKIHQHALQYLPLCTPEERWFGWDKKLKTEVSKRCRKYCNVARFCAQYQAEV